MGFEPVDKIKLGVTYIPFQVFEEYVNGLAESEFRYVPVVIIIKVLILHY